MNNRTERGSAGSNVMVKRGLLQLTRRYRARFCALEGAR